ncbi:MAG TPA: hypothetical protein VL334_04185 [Anaerolineae bacterium]|nr:hypothetical protein [Anaerolineae bacterium]
MRLIHRLPALLVLALTVLLAAACSFRPLLTSVSMQPAVISPNADGNDDATNISYTLGRTAEVSIYFEDQQGVRHYFRRDQLRSPGEYGVAWGGVVNEPETVDNGFGPQWVLGRVLPDGEYTWTVEARDERGQVATESGTITLVDGDLVLPELQNFTVVPQRFTPNQDSIDDWVSISYYLPKDVDDVQVYLVDPAEPAFKYYIAEKERVIKPGERGYHEYRYEADVDLGAEAPPDGDYLVYAEARDLAGNHVVVTSTLTIEDGGKPRADILQGEIDWQDEVNRVVSVPLGGSLCFTTTIQNEGTVSIRTAGPWPGTSYKFSQNHNTLANELDDASLYQQAGVWRFGVNFDTTGYDFPFRWAIGRPEDLEMRVIDGVEQWYLLPGQRSLVYGCIEFDQPPPVGTNFWWGGLIHEFVSVANNYVDRISVVVGAP